MAKLFQTLFTSNHQGANWTGWHLGTAIGISTECPPAVTVLLWIDSSATDGAISQDSDVLNMVVRKQRLAVQQTPDHPSKSNKDVSSPEEPSGSQSQSELRLLHIAMLHGAMGSFWASPRCLASSEGER